MKIQHLVWIVSMMIGAGAQSTYANSTTGELLICGKISIEEVGIENTSFRSHSGHIRNADKYVLHQAGNEGAVNKYILLYARYEIRKKSSASPKTDQIDYPEIMEEAYENEYTVCVAKPAFLSQHPEIRRNVYLGTPSAQYDRAEHELRSPKGVLVGGILTVLDIE